jgi:exopolysaccharide production protein ExoQ
MSRLKFIAATLFLLLQMGAGNIIDRSVYGEWPGKPGDKITEALNIFGMVLSILLFWWGITKTRTARFNRSLPLMVASLLLISVLWSVTPMVTVTRGIAYFSTVVGAIGIVELSDSTELMNLMAVASGISAVASVLAGVMIPNSALSTINDTIALRGIFTQKNTLGQNMMVGVLAGLYGLQCLQRARYRYFLLIALCTAVALAAKSGTTLLIIVLYFLLSPLTTLYVRGASGRVLSIILTTILIPPFCFSLFNPDIILSFLDKDPTLTGRTELWPYVIDIIYQEPVLGWGFQAFWIPSNPLAGEISSAVGWVVPEAHNGVLELLVQIGVVGTALFLFIFFRNCIMAIKCMNGPGTAIGASSLLFLAGIMALSVTETVLLTPDQFSTVQFFMMGFMCEKVLRIPREARVITQWSELYPRVSGM